MGDKNKKPKTNKKGITKPKTKNTCKNFQGKTYCTPGAYKRAIAKKKRQAERDANKSARAKKQEVRKSERELKQEVKKIKKNPKPVEYTEKYGNPRFL